MKYTFQNVSEEKLKEGIDLVRANGGSFWHGDRFEISGVEGTLSYENGTLIIRITDKPWLASWSIIERKLNEFFS